MLIDPFKRKISYVRVSVTDRCDFRCTYCMSEDMEFLPKKDAIEGLQQGATFQSFVAIYKIKENK